MPLVWRGVREDADDDDDDVDLRMDAGSAFDFEGGSTGSKKDIRGSLSLPMH